jgi:nucleoside-diphosphate-sugar epimerase
MEGKKILITGGMGLIGSNLAIRLSELGASVSIIDSMHPDYGGNWYNVEGYTKSFDIHIGDAVDEDLMGELVKNKDFVFNLAGQRSHIDSLERPMDDLRSNVLTSLALLEASKKHNPDLKIIHTGTRQIYGRPKYLPVDEKHPVAPIDINGANKLAAENYHLIYQHNFGIKTVIFRLTNTYGPRMRMKDGKQTFLAIWLKNMLEGKKFLVFGDGTQLRDFNFVDDVTEALIKGALADGCNGTVYNLGSDEVCSLLDLAKILNQINPDVEYELVNFPPNHKTIDIGNYYTDFNLAKSELGWMPKHNLLDGLMKTIDFYMENKSYYW